MYNNNNKPTRCRVFRLYICKQFWRIPTFSPHMTSVPETIRIPRICDFLVHPILCPLFHEGIVSSTPQVIAQVGTEALHTMVKAHFLLPEASAVPPSSKGIK